MVNKNKKPDNVKDKENLDEPLNLDLAPTTMLYPREQLKALRIKAAESGRSMGSILRGLLDNHLDVDDDEIKENVEDYFSEILESCGGFLGGFKISKFIDQMSDKKIELSHLNSSEWRSVLVKLEDSGLNGATNASDYRDLFSDLNPSRKQQKDLRKLGRKLLKQKKDEIW